MEPVPSECSGFAAKASSGCHDNAIFLGRNRIGQSRTHRLGRRAMRAGSWEQLRRLHDGHCRRLKTPKSSLIEPHAYTPTTMRGVYLGQAITDTDFPLLLSRQLGLHHTEAHTIRQPRTVIPLDFHSGPSTFVASRSETIGPLLADSSGMWLVGGGPVE